MRRAHGAHDDRDRLETDLLERLGLGNDATPERIAAAHDEVVAFLSSSPRSLAAWSRRQAAAADEAYLLLSDPVALAERAAADRQAEASPFALATVVEPNHRIRPDAVDEPLADEEPADEEPAEGAADGELSDDELDALIAAVTPSAHRDEVTPRAARGTTRPHATELRPRHAPAADGTRIRLPRAALLGGALVAAVALGLGIFHLGDPSIPPAVAGGSAGAAASVTPQPTLDEAQVAGLMAAVQADPKDTDALMGLGDAFFQAGQYQVSADWLEKLIAIDPKNVRALLALGAAEFNSGSIQDAEARWKQVVDLEPANVEAHYDLGFLYLERQPPDLDGVRREWQRVVELAPGTEVAQNVQAHLDAIGTPGPSASVTPSPSPAGLPASPGSTTTP
jgi:tetratricopeptide (TPR) repeat protein